MHSLPDRRDTGNWLARRATDTASFRDRFSGSIQDIAGMLVIVTFTVVALYWLEVLS